MLAIIIGIIVGICVGGPEEIVITLPNGTEIIGYKGEWTEWTYTECSEACGKGHHTAQRNCTIKDDSLDPVFCDTKNGTFEEFQSEVVDCQIAECVDECAEGTHTCSETCIDTPGSYNCICTSGKTPCRLWKFGY